MISIEENQYVLFLVYEEYGVSIAVVLDHSKVLFFRQKLKLACSKAQLIWVVNLTSFME